MAIRPIARPPEEAALQHYLQQGDHDRALLATAEAMGKELGQFCMALLDSQVEAEVVLGETLRAFHQALPQLVGRSLRMWLFGSALAGCRARLRSRPARAGAKAGALARRTSPPTRTPAGMRALLSALPRDQRETALLRYLGRLDYPAIASLCDTTAESARRKAGRALLQLRQATLDVEEADIP